MKRFLIIAAALLAVLVLVLAALPLLFGDAIEARARAAIDRRVEADVSISDIGLGLFRHFPNLAITVDEPTVTGVGAFDGDTLAHADRFLAVVDLASAFRTLRRGEPLVVRQVRVIRPYLHTTVLEDGRASWDIVKALEEAGADESLAPGQPQAVRVDLRELGVEEGRVVYEDRRTGFLATVRGLDHTLSGDLSAERADLVTRTSADAVSVRQAGVPYLTEAAVTLEADLFADMAAGRYALRENRLTVNELGLAFDGVVERLEDGLELDLTFTADRAGFRDLLSLVPALYTQDFEGLEADGAVAVGGSVRGRTGSGRVPSFALRASVEDGEFRYSDLPVPVTDVFLDLAVRQPASDLDSTVVAVDRLAFRLGDEPVRASLVLATPVSDPEVTASVDGTLDLAAAGRALKLEGFEELAGTVVADAQLHTRRSWIEAAAYDRVDAAGHVTLRDVAMTGSALPHPVALEAVELELSPRFVELPVLRGRVGSSDFRGSGRLDNLLGFALGDSVLVGRASIQSRRVALEEWQREEPRALEIIPVPGNVDLSLAAQADSLTLGRLVMTDARGSLEVRDRRVTLDDFGLATLGGEVLLTGWYETVEPDRPTFDLDLAIADLEIRGAFESLNSVRALAPAAAYAAGTFSGDLELAGVVGGEMTVVAGALNGGGGIRTRSLGIEGMPVLDRLAEALRVDALRSPTLSDFAASIAIRDGRLHVQPFGVRLGPAAATVSGSNGIDGSLDYDLELQLPRSALGTEADRVVTGLLERADRAGLQLADAEAVRIEAGIGGTMRDPRVSVRLAEALASAGADLADQARTRLEEEAGRQAAEARERVEQARAEAEAEARARLDRARAQARARADSILAAADDQAQRIREEAAAAATRVRQEADRQADRLEAEAANPIARRAAQAAGDRLRQEADRRATELEEAADERAEQLLDASRERATRILEEVGVPPETVLPDTTVADTTVELDSVPAPPDTTPAGSP